MRSNPVHRGYKLSPEIRKLLEDNDGKLPAYAWPGGYPIIYLDHRNNVVCTDCAQAALEDPDTFEKDLPVTYSVVYEMHDTFVEPCAECGQLIDAAQRKYKKRNPKRRKEMRSNPTYNFQRRHYQLQ